ncbi:hypothetical protein LSUE1_G005939 [Lachnellula suecica]|uniref:Collagen-like protein n=1 Tax=Lachnellula suecica TaxID=602035 RepID=A0A8T9C3D0_9HELO|nr:hypothetical protein LSUE1_G005939 [Lachnellula suecica]
MHITKLIVPFGALLSLTSARLASRAVNDPADEHLLKMCRPIYWQHFQAGSSPNGLIPSLRNSPFPCDQQLFIENGCIANGTTEIDFLAEQECLCNGSFFEVSAACDACYFVHGYQQVTPEEASSSLSSIKTAECSPNPPFQPYTNLFPAVNITSAPLSPSWTLGVDKFPNNTAISNYFTPTASATPGAITGIATARLTTWTNTDGNRFTPSSIPPNSGISTTGTNSSATGSLTSAEAAGSSITASPSPVQSTNLGVRGELKAAAGGLLAGVLGIAALL